MTLTERFQQIENGLKLCGLHEFQVNYLLALIADYGVAQRQDQNRANDRANEVQR